MGKLLILIILFLALGTGLTFAEQSLERDHSDVPKTEEVEEKKDCKKVCVKRDGYGKCIEFEEKCD